MIVHTIKVPRSLCLSHYSRVAMLIHPGRTAYVPETGVMASAFFVKSETGKDITIKTICSGHLLGEAPVPSEDVVLAITERRVESGSFQYFTTFGDSSQSWWGAGIFFSDDGTATQQFLEFASKEDLKGYLMNCTQSVLSDYCKGVGVRVGGSKDRQCRRLMKFYRAQATKSTSIASKFEDALGPVHDGEYSISGRVRRFYTNTYAAIDRFDALFYRIEYPIKNMSWEKYFSFCLLQQAVVNAYVYYCKLKDEKIPILKFLKLILVHYAAERTQSS